MASGGSLIPHADTLWGAIVDSPDVFMRWWEPWRKNEFELDLAAGHEQVVNQWGKVRLQPDDLLVTGQQWATVDYTTVTSPNVSGELRWAVESPGTGHGVAVWFDTRLFEDIGFSNAPGRPRLIYGQAFFPWPEPVELAEGDEVAVKLRADLLGDDYTWLWQTEVVPSDPSNSSAVRFDQSTFFSELVSPDRLRRQEAGHIPTLKLAGQADAFILSQMDGRSSLEEIARDVAARFPDHFPDWKAALTRAGELSVTHGK
jgi:protein arginine N-methyltransferase 1